jgi:HK97 family phage prohead protease
MSASAVARTVSNSVQDFSILKSDDLYIGGYASIEVVDKQNDLITLDALCEAVKKYMNDPKYRNVMTNHSNVQVGEVVKEYRDKNGKLWKTDVDDVGFFVVIKLRDDIEKAKEVSREIRKGTMRSFSIGGQALEKRKRNNDELGDYNEISKLELHEVTICEKGINPEAKFDILKQDKGEKMTNISEAISELNTLLKNLESENLDKGHGMGMPVEGEQMSENELMDDEDLGMDEMESADESPELGDLETMDDKAYGHDKEAMDVESTYKGEKDLPTGYLEAGEAGEELSPGQNKHAQIGSDGTVKSYSGETPTLDLSAENLEKAYAEFKAEQMEKLAYEDIKRSFQSRFDNEVTAKNEAIAKANYDPRAEVNELKKQFSDLLDTLKNDAEMTIKKQEDAIASLNVPTYEEISKMDWNDIHLTIQRLEEKF